MGQTCKYRILCYGSPAGNRTERMKKVRKTGKNMRKRLAAALAAGCMALGLCQAAKPLTVSADTADVVFVLDFSASMTWGVDSMSVSQEDGSDSRIQYMVNALNSAIDTLARANPDNRGNVGGLRRNENTDAGSENTGFCHSHPGKYHYDGRRGYYQ